MHSPDYERTAQIYISHTAIHGNTKFSVQLPTEGSLCSRTSVSSTKSCCYCWLYPCRGCYSLLQGLGNRCTGELSQSNSRCFGRGSATASFGLGNSFLGERTPEAWQQNWAQIIHSACNIAHVLAWLHHRQNYSLDNTFQLLYFPIEKRSSWG